MARRYWQEAGVAESFNFALIDADKGNYPPYYERCLELLAPGGVVMVDNVLWNGRVSEPDDREPDIVTIRAFNQHLGRD